MGQAVTGAPLAVVEVIGPDGQVRQGAAVHGWPFAIGRAVDNQLVLADPHVAPHHLRLVAPDVGPVGSGAAAVFVEVGETLNGVTVEATSGRRAEHLAAGSVTRLPDAGAPPVLHAGRTRLRVRLPGHALDPELPLGTPDATGWQRRVPLAAGLVALLGLLLFERWLEADPELFARAAGSTLAGLVATIALWCGAWALLSRIFTRRARFGWHLRVFVFASVAFLAIDALASAVSFAFDWPWLADFAFVGSIAVGGTALTYHLYAVEPARPRLARAIGALAAVGGIALTLWMNFQRTDRLGNDLYLSRLLPPAFRLAGTKPVAEFVDGLATLKPVLDRKARERESGDDGDSPGDEE
jgi:hypothetical protein